MAVTLAKQGDSHKVNLSKGGGNVLVNLKWEARKSGGFKLFGGGSGAAADLDLGCMYELQDGSKGVIQALGNAFGSRTASPFIALDGDDRAGGSADGENLFVGADKLKRVVIFAYIYSGGGDFRSVAGRVSMKVSNGEQIDLALDNPSGKTFCALAQIVNNGGQLTVSKEERYFGGHEECDRNYGFGFSWTRGSK